MIQLCGFTKWFIVCLSICISEAVLIDGILVGIYYFEKMRFFQNGHSQEIMKGGFYEES